MTRILNLIDDTNLGGVTRGLNDLVDRLGPAFSMTVGCVQTAWRIAPRVSADVIVVDFTLSWAKLLFLLSLRLRHRCPVVLVEHSYTAAYERECVPVRWRFRMMLRLSYRAVHRVVAVSEGQADWLRRARLVAARRLACIPQAIGTEDLASLPPAERQPGPLRLGTYGRFVPQKGFDLLIEAMRLVPPDVATLDLAGYGADEAALRSAATGLPQVRIHAGANPATFLPTVDCVILPSRWEAYGLVGQEARAAGRPLIAAAVDGLVEQVDARHGLLVPSNDPALLAAAIRSMAGRDLAPLGAAARQSVAGAMQRKVCAWRALFAALMPSRLAADPA